MGWEERNGRTYYYKKRRVGSSVRSEYVGAGELAQMIAQFDKKEQRQKQRELEKLRMERERIEEPDRQLNELERAIKDLIETVLTEGGFYKTSSREWRYRNQR